MTKILVGQVAPAIRLEDTEGRPASLAHYLKKGPVVVAFFKVSCPVCQYTFPFLERIHQNYANKNVTIVGISQDDAADTKEYLREYGVTFPALLDDERSYAVSNAYGLTNVPTVFLIAPNGKVLVSAMGFDRAALENISKELGRHFGQRPAPVFRPGENVPDYKPG